MKTKYCWLGPWVLLLVLVVALLSGSTGCATPNEDYVRADEAAWKHYDEGGRLDTWIAWAVERWEATEAAAKAKGEVPKHGPGEVSPEVAEALGHLNVGRKARVSHAIQALKKDGG